MEKNLGTNDGHPMQIVEETTVLRAQSALYTRHSVCSNTGFSTTSLFAFRPILSLIRFCSLNTTFSLLLFVLFFILFVDFFLFPPFLFTSHISSRK